MSSTTFRLLAITAVAFLLGGPLRASVDDHPPSEYQVKAAFLFNFARFVEWPADAFDGPDAPIILGILGDNPFGAAIEGIRGKTANGRKLVVHRFKEVDDINECHILFISASEKEQLARIFKALRHAKILLVGDTENFARRGGTINFVTAGNKIGLEINLDVAKREGLTISSRLLNMSKIISGI